MVEVLDRPDAEPSHKLGMAYKRLAVMSLERDEDQVMSLARKSLDAFIRAGAEDDIQAGKVRYIMGTLLLKRKDISGARDMFVGALPALRDRADGAQMLVDALSFAATVAIDEDDPGEALPLLIEAMHVMSLNVAKDKDPEQQEDFFALGLKVGRCLLDLKQFGEAEHQISNLLVLAEHVAPEDSTITLRLLDILGEARLSCGMYKEACEAYDEALSLGELAYGADSDEMAKLYTHRMWGHQVLEEHAEAVAVARKVVSIYEGMDIDSTRDSRYVDALWELAERYLDNEEYDEADRIAERLDELVSPVVGPDAPRTGQLQGLRGRIRFARGDMEDALPFLERAIELLDGSGVHPASYLELTRMVVDIKMQVGPIDEQLGPALERVIAALEAATRAVEQENAQMKHGVGMTPRNERS
jgi:tetratricopeptide (TPR) repeat protein